MNQYNAILIGGTNAQSLLVLTEKMSVIYMLERTKPGIEAKKEQYRLTGISPISGTLIYEFESTYSMGWDIKCEDTFDKIQCEIDAVGRFLKGLAYTSGFDNSIQEYGKQYIKQLKSNTRE